MKRNTSNWSNFGMLLCHAGLTASAGLSCFQQVSMTATDNETYKPIRWYKNISSSCDNLWHAVDARPVSLASGVFQFCENFVLDVGWKRLKVLRLYVVLVQLFQLRLQA